MLPFNVRIFWPSVYIALGIDTFFRLRFLGLKCSIHSRTWLYSAVLFAGPQLQRTYDKARIVQVPAHTQARMHECAHPGTNACTHTHMHALMHHVKGFRPAITRCSGEIGPYAVHLERLQRSGSKRECNSWV